MAGRSHLDARVSRALGQIQAQSQATSMARTVSHLEARISDQHREIQSLLVDNQRLAATHVALKQDLSASHQELRHLSATAAAVKSESDAQVREVYENARRLEAEARDIEGFAEKFTKVKEDIKKLVDERKELQKELDAVEEEIGKAKAELKEFPGVEAEIEAIKKELQMGRVAIEYEKKISATNTENSRIMEENMISMARELDKLNAELANVELANAEKRRRAAAVAAAAVATTPPNSTFPAGYVMPDHGYGGHFYSSSSAVPQVQSAGDSNPQYGHVTMPHSYDSEAKMRIDEVVENVDELVCKFCYKKDFILAAQAKA